MSGLYTPPDPTLGVDAIREANELYGLGYCVPAAFSARLAIEQAIHGRLSGVEREKGHLSFKKIAKRFHRDYGINSKQASAVADCYIRLSEYMHGRDFEPTTIALLIARCGELRKAIASAGSRNQPREELATCH